MSSGKILIADDDRNVHESLGIYLKSEGFETVDVYDGAAAVSALDGDISLCVMDIMMPIMNGIDACKEIRKNSQVPIIMLTAKGEEIDRILGLELGADDYIVKPFSVPELLARVRALLRRAAGTQRSEGKTISAGDIMLNTEERTAEKAGHSVELTAKEYDLMELLMRNPRRVYSRENLMNVVWGYSYGGDYRTVDVHIRRLREKMETDPAQPEYILTKWGVGYYFKG